MGGGGQARCPRRFVPGVEMLEERCLLATFMVTNAGDDVTGGTPFQLRWAIDQVNAGPGTGDSITFSLGLSGTPQTIALNAALPAITNPVSINGWSQNGGAPGVTIGINGGGLAGDGLTIDTYGSAIEGLAIYGFNGNGVDLYGNGDSISNCYVGTDTSGMATGVGNTGNGVVITGTGDTISSPANGGSGNGNSGNSGSGGSGMGGMGGLGGSGSGGSGSGTSGNNGSGSPGAGTVISDNGGQGVYVTGSSNLIQDSIIGLGADGETPLGNGGSGILLSSGASNNTLGAGNVISGNVGVGVTLSGLNVSGNEVVGDLIGTDATGEIAKQNGGDGVVIDAAPANTIGGTGSGAANVISGNAGNGITITDGAEDNLVSVNLIGTDQTGAVALGNGNDGVYVGSDNNTIGAWNGTSSGDGAPTVISGNQNAGIDLAGDYNDVVNCYVGADITGMVGLGNGADDIAAEGAGDDIGFCFAPVGPMPPPTVIIDGAGNGIDLTNKAKETVSNCYIGVDKDGTTPKGNKKDGVLISGAAASNNTIAGNVISANTGSGVTIESGAAKNVVTDNIIGLDKNGDNEVPNGLDGVSITGFFAAVKPTNNTVSDNVISGNKGCGVAIDDGTNNLVVNNIIGLDKSGSLYRGNLGAAGISLLRGSSNTIGGANAGNTISGNAEIGIQLFGSDKTVIQGNLIGTDPLGTLRMANGDDGVWCSNSQNTTIGGNSLAGQGNVISANVGNGIYLADATGTVVDGNCIGTDSTGEDILGNRKNGISVAFGGGVTIGQAGIGMGNVISGNGQAGVSFAAKASNNLVQGNLIGTDENGAFPVPNGTSGVAIAGSNNTIGGNWNTTGNIISGNSGDGITITGSNNSVLGNCIGTDITGTSTLLNNANNGITISGASNTIGGAAANQGNLISGNTGDGIYLYPDSATNLVVNNFIGTDATGTAKMANGVGIFLYGNKNTIGAGMNAAGTRGAGNIISGNTGDGVYIGGTNNTVLGNYIGVAADGVTKLGNGWSGIDIVGGTGNTIGGANAGNIISGNGTATNVGANNGVTFGNSAIGNALYNNFIGTDVTGKVVVGNAGDGVYIDPTAYVNYDATDPAWASGGANWNSIGGANGQGNVISGNAGYGVNVPDATATIPDGTIEDWNTIGVGAGLANKKGGRRSGKYGPNDKGQ